MNNKVSLKEERVSAIATKGKEYVLDQKMGMLALNGQIIIPREYDKVIEVDHNLFAAVNEKLSSGLYCGTDVIERSEILSHDLDSIWNKDIKLQISAVGIDFYSLSKKFNYDKKVLAYYYSVENKVLVLFNEDETWSIAYIDYENHEILEDEKYNNISEIKETYGGRFVIKQNDEYKLISLQDNFEFEFYPFIPVSFIEEGIVVKDICERLGFMNYTGTLIISCANTGIYPKKDYIKVEQDGKVGIWSYEGSCILLGYDSVTPITIGEQILFNVCEKRDGKKWFGLISAKYGKILSTKYSQLTVLSDGTIIYCKDRKYSLAKYIEKSGRVVDIMCGYNYMKFGKYGYTQYVIVRKGFKYAVYNSAGKQIRKLRYRCFIPRTDLWLYDYFEWL